MSGIENKINTILATINKMSTRIENKIDNFKSRLNQIESTLNKRIENLDKSQAYTNPRQSYKTGEQGQTN